MSDLVQEIRLAARRLVHDRSFTITALLTLALATGATTAVFTLVNAVLLRPLVYRDPEQLIRIYDVQPDVPTASISVPDARDYAAYNTTLDGIALFSGGQSTLTGGPEPVRLVNERINAGAFRVLGLPPLLGREFSPDEDQVGGPAVVMLGEKFWRQHFGGRLDALGSTLQLDGKTHQIVGVTRAQPHWGGDAEVWLPMQNDPAKNPRGTHFMNAIARMKPGVRLPAAQRDLERVVARIVESEPDYKYHGIKAVQWTDELLGESRGSLGALAAVVGLVLLIACVNLANLLLARGAARRREVAVRMALGADAWRIGRSLLLEALLLSVVGTALGLAVGWGGTVLLRSTLPERTQELAASTGLDGSVLGFTVLLCVVTAALFGVLPALILARGDLSAVRGELRTSLGRRAGWLQSSLVVLEVALALAPLLGAGLVLQSVNRMLKEDPGFRPEQAFAFRVYLPEVRYPDDAARRTFSETMVNRLQALRGVRFAGAVNDLPLNGSNTNGNFTIEGKTWEVGHEPAIEFRSASQGYIEAMGIPLLEGRTLEASDRSDTELVALVNATAVKRFWGGASPIGARIRPGDAHDNEPWRRVVGVVADVKFFSLRDPPRPEWYFPLSQDPSRRLTFVLRSREPLAPLMSAVQHEVAAVDSSMPVFDLRTLDQRLTDSVATPRSAALLLGLFAALGVLLAAAGVYGVLAYGVAQRTREIGIRMAIGASAPMVRWWVLRRALTLAGVGMAVGLVGALILGHALEKLLYGVRPTDISTLGSSMVMLALVSIVAAVVPARRATRVDPQEALRAE